jgi:hypothetical protein
MRRYYFLVVVFLLGCSPTKEDHIKQVKLEIANGGGEAAILKESEILFGRFSAESKSFPILSGDDRHFAGLSAITNLGDVFTCENYEPDRVGIRIHNRHEDTYFIYLLNTNLPEPTNFERIAGNVGFIN